MSTLGALHELKSGKHLAESLESEGELGEEAIEEEEVLKKKINFFIYLFK